jgi:2-hydroxy-3-oxopropionate reductase
MALNALRSGFDVAVYSRSGAAADLAGDGAALRASPAALAADREVVITIVTGTSDVEGVLLGPAGVAESAGPGTIVIDMSTIDPRATARIAEALAGRGIDMLDAPVSGGPMGARAATLTIMVGGDAAVLERARPVLATLGTTIVHMGGHGAGQLTKACNQLALLVAAQGVAEALTLAARYGADPAAVRQALLGGLAASRVLDLFGARMVAREFENGIDTRLYHKDLHIALDLARAAGQPAPAASAVMAAVDALVAAGRGRDDLSALITRLEDPAEA